MASVEELEELGRVIMSANVTAEYLDLPVVVNYLDTAFSCVVAHVVDARRRLAVSVAVEVEESVEGV